MKRYKNQIDVEGFGEESQTRLKGANVLIVGLGGTGGYVTEQLVRMGVGDIFLCDNDCVSLENLHRQTLYDEFDLGRNKIDSAMEPLRRVNSNVIMHSVHAFEQFDGRGQIDLIVDCTDNYETKIVLDEMSLELKIPLFSSGMGVFSGNVWSILPDSKLRLSDILVEYDQGRHVVLPPFCGVIGSLQANMIIDYFMGDLTSSKWLRMNIKDYSMEVNDL